MIPIRRRVETSVPASKQSANELENANQVKKTGWTVDLPPEEYLEQPLQLLTIMGISVCGYWSGQVGEYYSGWSLELHHPNYAN